MSAKKIRNTKAASAATPRPPKRAALAIVDWMLDYAVLGAHGDVDDLAAVARVRTYLHALVDGKAVAMPPSEADVLTVAALSAAAFEHKNQVRGLGEAVACAIDVATAPTVCGLTGRRLPRVAPHLYCVP